MRKPATKKTIKKKKAAVKKKKNSVKSNENGNGKKLTKAQQTLPPFLQKKIKEKK